MNDLNMLLSCFGEKMSGKGERKEGWERGRERGPERVRACAACDRPQPRPEVGLLRDVERDEGGQRVKL